MMERPSAAGVNVDTVDSDWRQRLAQEYRRIEQVPLPATVPDLLDLSAARFGDSTAVDFFEDEQALSFLALRMQVCALSHSFYRIGIRKSVHVGVLLSNRIEFPLTWLALARVGAVMVPVITSLKAREVDFILQDADVEFLIVESSILQNLDASTEIKRLLNSKRLIVVGAAVGVTAHAFDELIRTGQSDFDPPERPGPTDLLNIQYTSGTSGLPKGVMQSHRYWIIIGCVPSLMWRNEIRSMLSDHPFHYIDPQWMLLFGLYGGARVDFARKMSVRRFLDWLLIRRPQFANFALPLLKQPPHSAERQTAVKLFLGWNFSRDTVEAIQARFGARAREGYGMTEIGPALMVPYDVADPELYGTCGLPTPFRECRVVDQHFRDVPRGQAGELLVRGEGITVGYYKRPEANDKLFVDGWFRTGDIFVQSESGYYRLVGRLKDMIKRSGENVSAFEVENVLRTLPQVLDAAVVAVPDPERDEEVKAYLVLRPGTELSNLPPRAVLEHCRARLAHFKVPRYIEYVTDFPYTPSGKVVKHELVTRKSDQSLAVYDSRTDS